MDIVNDEYLNLFVQLNDGLKIKNIVKGGRLLLINDRNKEKIREILNKRLKIVKSISEAQGRILRKQRQIEPLEQLVSKVDKVQKTFKKTIKAILTSKSIKKFETKAKQFVERRKLERQPRVLRYEEEQAALQRNFIKTKAETQYVNNLRQYFELIKR